jgi:hypothetical protein
LVVCSAFDCTGNDPFSKRESLVVSLEERTTSWTRCTEVHPPDSPSIVNDAACRSEVEAESLSESHEMREFARVPASDLPKLSPMDDNGIAVQWSSERRTE